MIFGTGEALLFDALKMNTRADTLRLLREALLHVRADDVRANIERLIYKLGEMGDREFYSLFGGDGDLYVSG